MALDLPSLETRLRLLAVTQPTKVPGKYRLRVDALDLYFAPGVLRRYLADPVDCTVEVSAANLDKIVQNPNAVMTLYVTSKLKVSNVLFGQKLGACLSAALKG